MAIKRDELLTKREEVLTRIEELENRNKNARYVCNRYLEGFGMVESLEKDDLILAYRALKDAAGETDSTLAELGFDVDKEDKDYLGFSIDEWLTDLKTRASVLKNLETIEKLEEAIDIIDNNLSEDDRFSLEMKALEELL